MQTPEADDRIAASVSREATSNGAGPSSSAPEGALRYCFESHCTHHPLMLHVSHKICRHTPIIVTAAPFWAMQLWTVIISSMGA